MILKFGTKLDSDELYCVTKNKKTKNKNTKKKQKQKNSHILRISSFNLFHFSFSPMEISVTDFSAPIGASVLNFCVHL